MQIEKTILPNGLVVMTGALPHLESAAVGAFINAGARNETIENNGVAHFCEHMMFKGTPTRTAYDIAKEVEILGSDINAFTSKEMTAYYTVGLAQHIHEPVTIIADALINSVFAADDMALESSVILEEIGSSEDDPSDVMQEALQAICYPDQAVGRSILGSPKFLTSAKGDDIRAFTNQYYTADNMVVVGAGGIEHEHFVREVENAFKALPASADRPVMDSAAYHGGVHVDRSRDFKQVTIGIAFDAVSCVDDAMYHHTLLAEALGGGMSSPLFVEIREKRGLVYSTGSFAALNIDHGRMILHGGMSADNVPQFMDAACRELRKLCDAINPTDLTRARNSHLTSLATLREKPLNTACFMARSYWHRGRVRALEEMREQVMAVTVDDLRNAARRVLSTAPALSLVGPAPDLDYLDIVHRAIA